ncbi:uncharacterized protein [Mytilus edulis]|uniref:uncharacterized protein isoform X2 n=1 Tax=Mytilus edulis TaxID=6550 RepID=UPI0039EEC74B
MTIIDINTNKMANISKEKLDEYYLNLLEKTEYMTKENMHYFSHCTHLSTKRKISDSGKLLGNSTEMPLRAPLAGNKRIKGVWFEMQPKQLPKYSPYGTKRLIIPADKFMLHMCTKDSNGCVKDAHQYSDDSNDEDEDEDDDDNINEYDDEPFEKDVNKNNDTPSIRGEHHLNLAHGLHVKAKQINELHGLHETLKNKQDTCIAEELTVEETDASLGVNNSHTGSLPLCKEDIIEGSKGQIEHTTNEDIALETKKECELRPNHDEILMLKFEQNGYHNAENSEEDKRGGDICVPEKATYVAKTESSIKEPEKILQNLNLNPERVDMLKVQPNTIKKVKKGQYNIIDSFKCNKKIPLNLRYKREDFLRVDLEFIKASFECNLPAAMSNRKENTELPLLFFESAYIYNCGQYARFVLVR